jgi:hypothetical protein
LVLPAVVLNADVVDTEEQSAVGVHGEVERRTDRPRGRLDEVAGGAAGTCHGLASNLSAEGKPATDDGVELSEEARGALDRLMQELREHDVEGFALNATSCGELWKNCYQFTCTLDECKPLWSRPCVADTGCKIAEFGRIA